MVSESGIIDVHSHIIPGADDGCRYIGETLEMLKLAYSQGVRGVIATPHYVRGHNRMSADTLKEKTEKLRDSVKAVLPGMKIYQGQEILYFDGVTEKLASGEALTLEGTRYVLVEFMPSVPYNELFQAVRTLLLAGYFPILAHIERYQCLRKGGYVEELIHVGACMQMNYRCLSRAKGLAERAWCRKTVLEGNIHLLGTDMHRLDYRPPELEKTLAWLKKRGGEELTRKLTAENPTAILAGGSL